MRFEVENYGVRPIRRVVTDLVVYYDHV
jgi:hypothetical protein